LAVLIATLATAASAEAALLQISSDPFTNPTSQHATQVEPSVFASGNTLIAAFQSGRYIDGGASDIGYARSTNGGATWTEGFLPKITVFSDGGTNERATDAVVAYDARHKVWMIASLPITSTLGSPTVVVSRSTDGGVTWGAPVTVATNSSQDLDKPWIVCDNTPSSAYYGHCYVTYDDNGHSNTLYSSTSTDGGLTWGASLMPGGKAVSGIGGQPLVQPNGTVIVPVTNCCSTRDLGLNFAYESTNGGTSWTAPLKYIGVKTHAVAGPVRSGELPSAQIDSSGRVYMAWQDCRFRTACSANDIVFMSSTDGVNWTPITRIPIDATTSTSDHFLPTIAVDPTTSGSTAHLALTYYFFPKANCTYLTCQLKVGYVASADGGAHWTQPITLAGPMSLTWLANTDQGFMVGDYLAMTFANGKPHPVFAAAQAPVSGHFREAMDTWTGLAAPARDTATVASVPGRSISVRPSPNNLLALPPLALH
jgi:hypothetical protein